MKRLGYGYLLLMVALIGLGTAKAQNDQVAWQIRGEVDLGGDGFGNLTAVAVGPDGNIYIADAYLGVEVLNPGGDAIESFYIEGVGWIDGLAVGPEGGLWIADGLNQTLSYLAPDDSLIQVGGLGSGSGQFGEFSPTEIAVDSRGRAYVFDTQKDSSGAEFGRIQVFDTNLNLITSFRTDPTNLGNRVVAKIAIGGDRLYVGDLFGGVAVFDLNGNLLSENAMSGDLLYIYPEAMTADSQGRLYLASEGVVYQVEGQTGEILAQFGQLNAGDGPSNMGEFSLVQGLALLPEGDVVAIDYDASYWQIVRFSLN
jgi:DNA-binding beta-propeller fold protein YncE